MAEDRQAAYRDRLYARYFSSHFHRHTAAHSAARDRWAEAVHRRIADWLPSDRGASCLDIGCGDGKVLHMLRAAGYDRVEGVDRSLEQVERARALGSAGLHHADVLDFLEECRGRYDLITAFDVIEHFRKDEALRLLELANAALRPGGILIVQTPNGDSPWSTSILFGDFTHELCFTPGSLASVLRITGFGSLDFREAAPVARGVRSSVRWLLWQVLRSGMSAWNLVETGHSGSRVLSRVFLARGRKT